MAFDVDPNPKAKVTQNDAQFPLHHVNFAPVKFGSATFNSLGSLGSSLIIFSSFFYFSFLGQK